MIDALLTSEAFFSPELESLRDWSKEKFEGHFEKVEKVRMNLEGAILSKVVVDAGM